MPTARPKILVIDDTHANLVAMKVLLQDVNAEIITADSGNSGLAKAMEESIALILLDVNMPEMDGFEAAELLSTMEETRDIPIIFLTAIQSDEDKRLQGYNAGAVDYIHKPVNTDILLSKIQVFLKIWTLRFGLEEEIRRREKVERDIEYLAQHDTLTQLPNRRQLHIEINQMIDRSKRLNNKFGVLFLDLDDFKKINDELGHQAGDAFLKDIAQRFRSLIRSFDVIARYGGDEFIVLISDLTDTLSLTSRLEEIVKQGQKVFVWEGMNLQAGVSVGVSIFPDHGSNGDSLIKHADAAMYLAKEAGRGQFRFYTDDLNRCLQRRLVLEHHMHTALQNGEFEVYYQPIVGLQNGHPAGAEALLRWCNPELGNVSPAEFIPVAERMGMIHDIGLWVLNESMPLTLTYPDLIIAVNASAVQFNDDRFCNELERMIENGELNPKNATIEITEGILLSNAVEVDKRLNRIREMGINLAIDDFGTGYSALSYLKRCPVNKLKIDRAFVSGLPQDVESVALVKAVIAMGHALGMALIAEGLETQSQWDFLKQLDCDKAQGFFFSKPLPRDAFEAYLKAHQTIDLIKK